MMLRLFSPGNVLLAQCLSGHGMQHGEVINFQLLNGNQELPECQQA